MKIAIIGAMEEEVQILRDMLTEKETTIVAGTEFTTGMLHDKEIVLLKSGIGKVNAAMATAILLDRYAPDVVLNTGSAGGYDPELNVGDLVISTDVIQHDVDATGFGYAYGEVPGMPVKYAADEALLQKTMDAIHHVLDEQVKKGLIGTGDIFMHEPERVEWVRSQFPELIAVEMEAGAIAQVCYLFKTPFVVIRALSDIAGKESGISFDQFLHVAAANSTKLLVEVVKTL